jgi:hypothetical protein
MAAQLDRAPRGGRAEAEPACILRDSPLREQSQSEDGSSCRGESKGMRGATSEFPDTNSLQHDLLNLRGWN